MGNKENKLFDRLSDEFTTLNERFNSEDFKSYNDLIKNVPEDIAELANTIAMVVPEHSKPIILNYDEKLRNTMEELDDLANYLNGGIVMDEKDMKLLQNDIRDTINKGMKELNVEIDEKIVTVSERLNDIEKGTKQNCEDGNCITKSLTEIRKELDAIKSNNTINDEADHNITNEISIMKETLDKVCTGMDCITKRYEEEDNTAKCPSCNESFLWTDGITTCPHCGIPIALS